jgi:hypothetical protein
VPLLALACAGCLLAPWFTTGAVTRSGYGFLRAWEASGLAAGLDGRLLVGAAFALPLLAGVSAAAFVLHRRRWATGAASGAGAVLAVLSSFVLARQAGAGPAGPWAGAVVGSLTLALPAARGLRGRDR